MIGDTRTHENEDPVSILLPAINHLVVFFLCSLGVYGEERSRAVTEVGFSLGWRTWCRLRVVGVILGVIICYRHHKMMNSASKGETKRVTNTWVLAWVVSHVDDLVSSLRH